MTRFEEVAKEYFQNAFGRPLLIENEEGVDGIDILDSQESALGVEGGDSEPSADVAKMVFLTNLLIKSLRFRPSDGLKAYVNMPRFAELKPDQKLTAIRSVMEKHPDRIFREALGDEEELGAEEELPPTEEVPEFGEEDIEVDETTELDMLNLIVKVFSVDPFVLTDSLNKLPSQANEDNYQEVVEIIEGIVS